MGRALLMEIVGWAVGGLLMTLLMGWAARDRLRPRRPDEPLRLVNPPSVLIFGLVTFLFFVTLLLLAFVFFRNETSSAWVGLVFGALAAMGLWLVVTWAIERIDVSPAGVSRRTPIGTRQAVAWHDIGIVEWSPGMRWFLITATDGTRLRVSAMLRNLPEFARALLALAPGARMDEETRDILEGTSRGELPPLT